MSVTIPGPMATSEKSVAVTLRVALARIYRAMRLSATTEITPSQVSVLFRIEQSGPIRMGVIAQLERITPASLSKVVDSLEALALVEREPDPLDGRVTLLKVSDAGRDLISERRAESTLALEEALTKLTPSERSLVHRSLPALEKLAEILLVGSDDV
jgi:DNA-binding MarR family transcriptional regulator